MSTATQVESFCESCGTRYAFEPRRSPKRHLVKVGRLVGILADEPDVDDSALVVSKDPFHGAFHFCLECRRFTCPTCWDAAAGFCRSCASVLSGGDDAAEVAYTLDADTQALLRAAFEDLSRLGADDTWSQLQPPPEARPQRVVATPDIGDAPEDDLTQIIEAGAAARAAREAQAARESAEAAEREQARLDEERRQQAEADRLAAEQAEEQRLAWERYEAERQQYELDLAAWEAAEAQRVAAEDAQRHAAFQAEQAEQAEAAEAARRAAMAAEADRQAAERAEAARVAALMSAHALATEHADQERAAAEQAEAQRLAQEAYAAQEAQRLAAERAEAERLAAEAARAEAERLATEAASALPDPVEDPVWDSLAGALGPDVAAEAAVEPVVPERPQLPLMPQVPPPSMPDGPWQMGAPPAGMPGWAPPRQAPGQHPQAGGWNGGLAAGPGGMNGNGQLRTGIRPCARCDLALSANARFCRRCGLPQG